MPLAFNNKCHCKEPNTLLNEKRTIPSKNQNRFTVAICEITLLKPNL